jgi:hypothetical protein
MSEYSIRTLGLACLWDGWDVDGSTKISLTQKLTRNISRPHVIQPRDISNRNIRISNTSAITTPHTALCLQNILHTRRFRNWLYLSSVYWLLLRWQVYIIFYFKIIGEGWDQAWDLLNTSLAHQSPDKHNDNQSPEDGSRANFRNADLYQYRPTSDNEQCLT